MGQCCQKTSKYGFQADLASPLLLNDIYDRLPIEARVLHIRLVGLKDIAAGSAYNGLSDAYVEMKVMPNDPVAGAQQQLSEVKPQTLNPTWVRFYPLSVVALLLRELSFMPLCVVCRCLRRVINSFCPNPTTHVFSFPCIISITMIPRSHCLWVMAF